LKSSTNSFKIGLDNYSLSPLHLSPIDVLQWAIDKGADGVFFSGLVTQDQKKITKQYLIDLRQFAESNHLYLEWGGAQHIPRDLNSWQEKNIFEINKKAAQQAAILGVRVLRSCSGGLMRWDHNSPATETLLLEMAKGLKAQRQMLMDYNVILAIETHFEFTTFELLKVFEYCETEPGEYLGICLDTMNFLTMLENPLWATERILPWVIATHIKDGGILLDEKGLTSFVVALGKGVINFKKIISRLKTLSRQVHLSIEDHGGCFSMPIFEPLFLSKFPDLSSGELASLIELALKYKNKVAAGECQIVERSHWAEICEQRIVRDLKTLKKIIHNL